MSLDRLATLPFLIKATIVGVAAVVLFKWLRLGWMTWQARAAMAREMAVRNLTVKSIRRSFVWRGCGSIWNAMWHLALDYRVVAYTAEGKSREMSFEVLFVPVIGRLRAVRVWVPKGPCEGGGMEYHCPEEESA